MRLKLTILLKRNPSMSHDEFVTYHREHHAGLFMSVAAVQANVRSYTTGKSIEGGCPKRPTTG